MASGKISIGYLNHEGNGFATSEEVTAGTTVSEYFRAKMPGKSANSFLIKVNDRPVGASYVLRSDDVVSITPSKVQGA